MTRHRAPRPARHGRLALVAVAATVGLVVAGAAAIAATTTAHATCTGSPALTQTTGGQKFSVTCTVPNPPASTVTETVPASPSPSDTPTPTPTPSETPSPTPSETPTPTPTPSVTPTPSPSPTQAPTGQPFTPYTAGSYFYSAPSQYGTIDPAATTAMRSFLASVGAKYPTLNGLGSNAWGMAYAVGQPSDPVWHLKGSAVDPRLASNGPGFHAPADLGQRVSGSTDSPGIVLDLADGITVTFGKAHPDSTAPLTLDVLNGGYYEHGSNGLDKRRPESTSTHNTSSRGRIPDTMLVRGDLFTWALANHTDLGHVLEVFWPETDSSAGYRFPMAGAEGSQAGWGAEGQRIGIDPAINLTARPGCTPEALVIALTLQRHGAYIGDNAGGNAWAIKMEQNSAADPTSSGAFKNVSQAELAGCVSSSDFVAYTTPK